MMSGETIRCGHSDDDPAQPVQRLTAANVLRVLPAVEAVLFAVVLDGDHELLPSHVEVVHLRPAASHHRDLGRRRWQARADQE